VISLGKSRPISLMHAQTRPFVLQYSVYNTAQVQCVTLACMSWFAHNWIIAVWHLFNLRVSILTSASAIYSRAKWVSHLPLFNDESITGKLTRVSKCNVVTGQYTFTLDWFYKCYHSELLTPPLPPCTKYQHYAAIWRQKT